MSESLQATFESRKSGANMLRLSGVVHEQRELDALLPSMAPGRIVVHLGNIEHLSEAGMRAWVAWLATLDARNVKADLVACSPKIVQAFNEDSQLARCARVKSVQVAYRCAKCERVDMLVVPISEVQKASGRAPHRACEQCVGRLVMVEDPARYFEFVAHLPRRSAVSIDSLAEMARGSGLKIPTQHMLPVRPSTYSILQNVLAKTGVESGTPTNRNYLVVALVLAIFACGLASALMLL